MAGCCCTICCGANAGKASVVVRAFPLADLTCMIRVGYAKPLWLSRYSTHLWSFKPWVYV